MNSLEGVVIRALCKTIPVEVQAKEEYYSYYCQAFALRSVAALFGVGERSRLITNRFCRVARLFLQEDTTALDVACVCV